MSDVCQLAEPLAVSLLARDHLHLYLSPHYDDAIFSCGGLIHAQRQAGCRVGVLTLCAGSPDPRPCSPLARRYESAWSESGDGLALRRAENSAALSSLGMCIWSGGAPDAVYRASAGSPYYSTRADLFGDPHWRDAAAVLPVWTEQVRHLVEEEAQPVLLYAPLGVGGHVDHELARRLAQHMGEAGRVVRFYEDYPYVELTPGGIEEAQDRFGPHTWTCGTVAIDVRAKIEAVRNYRTQIGPVFGCEKTMVRRISGFTAVTACALSARERMCRRLAPGGLRLHLWRRVLGYHAHAERVWSWCAGNGTK